MDQNRRRFLGLTGAALTTGLAGCTGGSGGQTMTRIRRTGSGPHDYDREEFHNFRFVPLVQEDEDDA